MMDCYMITSRLIFFLCILWNIVIMITILILHQIIMSRDLL